MLVTSKLNRLEGIDFRAGADSDRISRYRREKLFFNGAEISIPFVDMTAGENFHPDLVIVSTKGWQLEKAAEMLGKYISPGCIILPLLNGISSVEFLQRRFPHARVLYGYFIGHASVRTGTSVNHDGVGTFFFGDADNRELSAETLAVEELFRRAGINCTIPQDMIYSMWKKYILNVGVNQATAYFKVTYGGLQQDSKKLDFALNLMLEARTVAGYCGVKTDDLMIKDAMDLILTMPPQAMTSMYQDICNGTPTEIGLFAGEICRLAEKFSIDVPYNRQILAAIDR